jgi:hypothetical protein
MMNARSCSIEVLLRLDPIGLNRVCEEEETQ